MSEEKPKLKTSTSRTLEHRIDGSPYFRLVTTTHEFDFWERKWVKKSEAISELTPLDVGLFRETEILVSFPRTAVDTRTLKTLSAFFVQRLKVSVDQGRQFRHVYLSLTNGKIFLQYLGFNGRYSGLCVKADLNGKEESLVIQKIGKPRRISAERLDAMLKTHEISIGFSDEKFGEIFLPPKNE